MAGRLSAKKEKLEQDKRFRKLLNRLDGHVNKRLPEKFLKFKSTLKSYLRPADIATDNFLDICDTLETKGKISPRKLKRLKEAINKDLDNAAYKLICEAEEDMIKIANGTYVEEKDPDTSEDEETESEMKQKPGNETDAVKLEKRETGSSMTGFHKKTDTTTTWEDLSIYFQNEFNRSVGILRVKQSHSNSHGTCFRVGHGRCVMTAYHVVGNAIELMIQQIASRILLSLDDDNLTQRVADTLHVNTDNIMQDDEDKAMNQVLKKYLRSTAPELNISNLFNVLGGVIPQVALGKIKKLVTEKLWTNVCSVTFECQEEALNFDHDIPFADEYNDVIILQVSGDCQLPKPVILDASDHPKETLVFGYPGTSKLQMDIRCPVYTREEDLEKDVEKAIDWWMSHTHNTDRLYFQDGYKNVKNKVILHTSESFVFGASGGPMTKSDRIQGSPLVCMMYQGGFPDFYYEETNQFYKHKDTPEEVRFEACISMKQISELLRASHKDALRKDIFKVIENEEMDIN